MDAGARLDRYIADRGLTVVRALDGGAGVSDVRVVTYRAGERSVVKADRGRPESVRSEAAWLARHPHAPRVLDLDTNLDVLHLEHIDSRRLDEHPGTPDVARDARWLRDAEVASGVPDGPVDDIRDRYRAAYTAIVARGGGGPWDAGGAADWLDWADELPDTGWMSVALDVICKNTLVDSGGRWWAIDPLCAWAPPEVVWCPWLVDRPRRTWGDDLAATIAYQEAMLGTADDPDMIATWMPGAMLWTLWWRRPGRALHQVTVAGLGHWLDVWRRDHH